MSHRIMKEVLCFTSIHCFFFYLLFLKKNINIFFLSKIDRWKWQDGLWDGKKTTSEGGLVVYHFQARDEYFISLEYKFNIFTYYKIVVHFINIWIHCIYLNNMTKYFEFIFEDTGNGCFELLEIRTDYFEKH